MQGQFYANCPFISALASLAWINRNFIKSNISGPDGNGNYTFTFYDQGVNSGVTLPNSNLGTPVQVTISPQVLLDNSGAGAISNANGSYGAGSFYANEYWPALYELAYAKFCYYENGLQLQGQNLTLAGNSITGPTPAFSDLWALANNTVGNYWGGNGAYVLMYLAPLHCFTLTPLTAPGHFAAMGGVTGVTATAANAASSAISVSSASASGKPTTSMSGLYTFIEIGLCSETSILDGMYKTRYPCVATTYASAAQSPNPAAVTYSNTTIVPNHDYSILGVFDAPNGYHYLILRNTFGANPNYPNPSFPNPIFGNVATGAWSYYPTTNQPGPYDAMFPIGTTTQYPANASRNSRIPLAITLSSTTPNGIFGLEQGAFINYFTSIGWAQGY